MDGKLGCFECWAFFDQEHHNQLGYNRSVSLRRRETETSDPDAEPDNSHPRTLNPNPYTVIPIMSKSRHAKFRCP